MPTKKIANPKYDVTLKALLSDPDIARGIAELFLGRPVEAVAFSSQESVIRDPRTKRVALRRLDFSAVVTFAEGDHRQVILEIQAQRQRGDTMRFRLYLASQLTREHEIMSAGIRRKIMLPVVPIYILGYEIGAGEGAALPAVIHVERRCRCAVTAQPFSERPDFIEALTHDAFIIQIPRLAAEADALEGSALGRFSLLFNQRNADPADPRLLEVDESLAAGDHLLDRILGCLSRLGADPEHAEKMTEEEQSYRLWEANFGDILHELERSKATALEERRLREEEREKTRRAVVALHEAGHSPGRIADLLKVATAEIAAILGKADD